MIPLISRERLPSECQQVDIWRQHFLIWILGFSIKQPIKSDSVSSRYMSQRGTSSFFFHLDRGFAVFKNVHLRFPLRRTSFSIDTFGLGAGITIMSSWVEHTQVSLSWYGWVGLAHLCDQVECRPWLYVAPRSQCAIGQAQVAHPYVAQHPEK